MIGRLRGHLAYCRAGVTLIDCAGVGYEVHVSAQTATGLEAFGVADVSLLIYTHVRENILALYGFATADEREVFDLLVQVENVGPTKAIAALRAEPAAIVRAIAAEDTAWLKKNGFGPKMAEAAVVELHDDAVKLMAKWGLE